MVYCGKPSGSCHACRERRTRCDKLPNGCTQCINAKRVCPGYRALGDVLFRDVTSNVIRKAKSGGARTKQVALVSASAPASATVLASGSSSRSTSNPNTPGATPDDCSNDAVEDGSEVVAQPSSSLEIFSLVPTIDERATGFFVANYVYGSNGPGGGHLDYLTEVFRGESLDDGLLACMKAVGLAGFAHTTRSPDLIKSARYQYVKAIQHTNTALQSPAAAKKDTTLLSIIILGIFESLTGGTQRSLRDWVTHINGATNVINIRGHEGIRNMAGRRMLFQVSTNLLISCVQRGEPIPAHMSELIYATIASIRGQSLANKIQTGEPAFIILDCMIRFAQLRSDIVKRLETDPHVILARCLSIENVLIDVTANSSGQWAVKTVHAGYESEYLYNGRYHLYYDSTISQSWNALRMMRFMLNEIVRDLLTTGIPPFGPSLSGAEYAEQLQTSIAAMYSVQDDILYSIPQQIGFTPQVGPSGDIDARLDEDNFARSVWMDFQDKPDLERPLARISTVLFMIWPLWFVGINDMSSDAIRRFVVKNLRAVGDKFGIHQAYLLAMAVESQIMLEVST